MSYRTPFTICLVVATGAPPRVRATSDPPGTSDGTIASRPRARGARSTVKDSWFPAYETPPNDDAFRPSSQSSICRAVTTGTLRACASATIAFAPACTLWSVCMFVVNTP